MRSLWENEQSKETLWDISTEGQGNNRSQKGMRANCQGAGCREEGTQPLV